MTFKDHVVKHIPNTERLDRDTINLVTRGGFPYNPRKYIFYSRLHKTFHTHIKDLKSSNVQHTDEVLASLLGIQRLVDSHHHPQEHFLVHRLGQCTDRVAHLDNCIKSMPVKFLNFILQTPDGFRCIFNLLAAHFDLW